MNSDDLGKLLQRHGAALSLWQVEALFLGALTSTNIKLGPHHLLDRIFPGGELPGGSIEEANEILKGIGDLWNQLVERQRQSGIELSGLPLSDTPSVDDIRAFAHRLHDEIRWFIRGIDAGGDDPLEFGEEGQDSLRRLAEGAGFARAYQQRLEDDADVSLEVRRDSAKSLRQLKQTVEDLMTDLARVGAAVRAQAIREYERKTSAERGTPGPSSAKIGRNSPCPCGSGKKWKRCCGAAPTVH